MIKNVLHLRSSAGIFGAENVVLELSKHTPSFGYRSFIGSIYDAEDGYPEFLDRAKTNGLDAVAFAGKGKLDIDRIRRIRDFIKENRIDILHCHGYKEDLHGFLAFSRIPLIATNHLWKKMYWRMKTYCLIDAFMLQFFDMVVGVSDEIISEMKKYRIRRTTKIANGIDTERYRPMPKSERLMRTFGLGANHTVLGMISSITPEKGHHRAIDAFYAIAKRLPDTRLFIVGEGFYEAEIRKHVSRLHLDEMVIFAGKQTDIPEVLSVIDIFLLPSLNEGLPMALLEAMSAGKAVIASRVGEIPKVIDHGRTGIIVPPSDHAMLQEALFELLTNRIDIKQLGESARETITQGYTSRKMAKRYCELYDSIIGQRA